MKGTKRIYLLPLLAVSLLMQLTGSVFRTEASPDSGVSISSAAGPGEWRLVLPLAPPWYPTPPPGDGSMKIDNLIRFDERGGEMEVKLTQSQEKCTQTDKVEVIYFKWTFTSSIIRLLPGATVPLTVEARLLKGNKCDFAEGHTELALHPSDAALSPPSMPKDQVWQGFSNTFVPGVRLNFYLSPPGASSGQTAFKINESTPGCNDPKVGWFAFTISTTSTRFGQQYEFVHFFYKYVFVPAGRKYALQTSSGNYVTAVNGGGIGGPGALHTDARSIQAWETFSFIEQTCGKYGIQTANGNFWTAVNGGGVGGPDAIHTDARSIQGWELFTLVPQGGDIYAIKTFNGRYLTAVGGGGRSTGDIVHTDATAINAWERFRLVPVN